MESEVGFYTVLNRGNYRADLFRTEKTKTAFLPCLEEACGKPGGRVHAWCLMSNHSHLAIASRRRRTGWMVRRGLQCTFAKRFNQTPRPDSVTCSAFI